MADINEQALRLSLSIDDTLVAQAIDNLEKRVIDLNVKLSETLTNSFKSVAVKIDEHVELLDRAFKDISVGFDLTGVMSNLKEISTSIKEMATTSVGIDPLASVNKTAKEVLKTESKNRLELGKELKDRLQIQKISKFLSLSSMKDYLLQIKDSKLIKEFFENTKKINKEITNKNELHKEQNELLETDNYLINKFRKGVLDVIDTTKNYLFTAKGAVEAWTAIIDAVITADKATDNFITTNYRLYGSQYDLLGQSRELSASLGVSVDSAIEAYQALANNRTPIDQIDKLAESISKANVFLGINIDELAEYSRQNRLAGGTSKDSERMFNYAASAMKKFGLNSAEVAKILTGTKMSVTDLTLSFGKLDANGKPVANTYKEQMLVFAGLAKQMGYTTEAATSLFEANSSAMNKARLGMILGRDIKTVEEYGAAVNAIGFGLEDMGISLDEINKYGVGSAERAQVEMAALAQAKIYGIETSEQLMLALERSRDLRKEGVKGAQDFEGIIKANAKLADGMANPFSEANATLTRQIDLLKNALSSLIDGALTDFSYSLMTIVRTASVFLIPTFRILSFVIKGMAYALNALLFPFNMLITAISTFISTVRYYKEVNALTRNLAYAIEYLVFAVGKLIKAGSMFIGFLIGAHLALMAFGSSLSAISPQLWLLSAIIYAVYVNWSDLVNLISEYAAWIGLTDMLKTVRETIEMLDIGWFAENWERSIGIAISSVILLGFGIRTLYRNFTLLSAIKKPQIFDWLMGKIRGTKLSIGGLKKTLTKTDWSGIFNNIRQAMGGFFDTVIEKAKSWVKGIGDTAKSAVDVVVDVSRKIGIALKNIFKGLTLKDAFIILAVAGAMWIFAKACAVVAENLWPTIIAMAAMTLAVFVLGKVLAGIGKAFMNPAVAAGVGIFTLALLGLSIAAYILAQALAVAAPSMALLMKAMSESSGVQIVFVGLAMAVAIAAIGTAAYFAYPGLLLFTVASLVLATALNIAMPAIVQLIEALSKSGPGIAAAGVAFAGALATIGFAAILAAPGLFLISGPLDSISRISGSNLALIGVGLVSMAAGVSALKEVGVLSMSKVAIALSFVSSQLRRSSASLLEAAPGFVQFGDGAIRFGTGLQSMAKGAADLMQADLMAVSAKIIQFGKDLEDNVDSIVSPITLIAESIERLNSALTELMSKSMDSVSKLGPAVRDLSSNISGRAINAETINASGITTTTIGGDKKDSGRESYNAIMVLNETLREFMEQTKSSNKEKIDLLSQQVAALAGGARSNMATEYNSWVS